MIAGDAKPSPTVTEDVKIVEEEASEVTMG